MPTRRKPDTEPTSDSDGDPALPDTAEDISDEPVDTMTLEELAERSGVAARTIRFYQGEKLLQKPERDRSDGRVARYGPAHVERLRLIGELRDRGLKLPAIGNLLAEGDAGTRVADWLGLDASLRGSWGAVEPRILTVADLDAALDATPTGTRGALEDAGLLRREGAAWLVVNPGLFDVCVGLVVGGVPTDLVLEAGVILGKSLDVAARELVDLFVTLVARGYGHDAETATLLDALRPAAGDAARLIFEQQLERAISALLADTRRLGKMQGA